MGQSISRTGLQGDLLPAPTSTDVNVDMARPVQPLVRTEQGKTVSWSTKEPFVINSDNNGRTHIRFSHCPELAFPSMQYAFDYFHVQGKLHDQRFIQLDRQQRLQAAQRGLQVAQRCRQVEQQGYLAEQLDSQAGRLADSATQHVCLAEKRSSIEPVWRFDPPLKPIDAQCVAKLPTPPSSSVSDSQYQHATESFTQCQSKEPDPVHSSSESLAPDSPPHTLFAESTPHAQEIQARPRVRLPVKGLQSWPFQSQVTKGDPSLRSVSSTQLADEAITLPGSRYQPSTCIGTNLPQTLTNTVDISDRPLMFPLSSPYADIALPQTLNRKDRRILGVSLSAGIDE